MKARFKSKTLPLRRKSRLKNTQLDLQPDLHSVIDLDFLRSIMPKSVPEQALQAELARLHQRDIFLLTDLKNFAPEELEKIVRPVTARTLLTQLPTTTTSASSRSPSLSPHVTRDENSPSLFRNRLKLRIGAHRETDGSPEPMESVTEPEVPSPLLLRSQRHCRFPSGEDQDMFLSLNVLQSLMPFADRDTVQQDLAKLTRAGIVHLDQLEQHSSEELARIVGPTTAGLLQTCRHTDAALSMPFLSVSPVHSNSLPQARTLSLSPRSENSEDSFRRRRPQRFVFESMLFEP